MWRRFFFEKKKDAHVTFLRIYHTIRRYHANFVAVTPVVVKMIMSLDFKSRQLQSIVIGLSVESPLRRLWISISRVMKIWGEPRSLFTSATVDVFSTVSDFNSSLSLTCLAVCSAMRVALRVAVMVKGIPSIDGYSCLKRAARALALSFILGLVLILGPSCLDFAVRQLATQEFDVFTNLR